MKDGDAVFVMGKKRILVRALAPELESGWELNKPVEGFRFWNQEDIRLVPISKSDRFKLNEAPRSPFGVGKE